MRSIKVISRWAKTFRIHGWGNIHLPFTLMFGREGCDPTAFFHYLRQPPAWGLSLWHNSTKAKERHPELHASHSNLRRDTRSTADELAPGRQRRHNHVSFEKAWHGQGIFSLPTQLKRIWNHPLSLEIAWAGRTAAAKEFPTCRDLYIISPRHCACLSRRKSQNLRKVTVHSASLCVFRAGRNTPVLSLLSPWNVSRTKNGHAQPLLPWLLIALECLACEAMHAPGFSMWCLKNTDDPNVLSKLAPCAKKSKGKEKRKLLRWVREEHLKWRVPKAMVCLSQPHVFDDVIGSTTCRNHQSWASESVVPLWVIHSHWCVNKPLTHY